MITTDTRDERVEDLIDQFELTWSAESRDDIRDRLQRYHLSGDAEAITELLRIDIERRYTAGLPVDLADYASAFGDELSDSAWACEIAFEDYRSRRVCGLPVDPSRYRDVPDVQEQSWYRDLGSVTRVAPEAGDANLSDHRGDDRWRDEVRGARSLPLPSDGYHGQSALELGHGVDVKLRQLGFAVQKRIGRGAFSDVYLATQGDLADRYVVLKLVREDWSEPERLAMLQHTNIVPIYSVHRVADRTVICMPYAGDLTLGEYLRRHDDPQIRGGQSLVRTLGNTLQDTVNDAASSWWQDRPNSVVKAGHLGNDAGRRTPTKHPDSSFPLDRLASMDRNALAIWLFRRLARALSHSHARGVLHRDLKPANVLIRNDGEPALLDFNLSHSTDRRDAQRVGGTLPYMAPESFHAMMGCVVTPDARTDLYGLGVMLYEFLVGKLPYTPPRSPAAIDLEVAIEDRRKPLAWPAHAGVPDSLRRIVQRCLEFHPAQRYASAEQLRQDLLAQSTDRTLPFTPEPVGARVGKWFRRHPKWLSGGVVAALLLACLVPTAGFAVRWRDQSRWLNAKIEFDTFAKRSTELLTKQIVDPLRHSSSNVNAALQPLLQANGMRSGRLPRWLAVDGLTSEQRQRRGDALMRHAGHVALNEIERLKAANPDRPVHRQELRTLDRLIETCDQLMGASASRMVLQIKADRARLLGLDEAAEALERQAQDTAMKGDADPYLHAVRRIHERRYLDAIEVLSGLADREIVPSTLRWVMLARSQWEANRYEDAKLSYTQAIERAPESSRLWYLRGRCYQSLRRMDRARDDYTEALRREPTFVSARWTRAQTLVMTGKPEAALQDLNEGLRLQPDQPTLLIARSDVHRRLGNQERAERDLRLAIQAPASDFRDLLNRGKLRLDRDPEGALADLQAAASAERNAPRVHHFIAQAQTKLGRVDEAIETLAFVEKLRPESDQATVDKAVLLARQGRESEAHEAVREALLAPNSPRTLYQAACTYALLDDPRYFPDAVTLLADAVQRGYGLQSLVDDPDLRGISNMPGFQATRRVAALAQRSRRKFPSATDPTDLPPDPDTSFSSDN